MRRAVNGPLADYARLQEQTTRALQGPVLRALEQERALQTALEGPLAAIAANQARVRKALVEPLARVRRNQEAMVSAVQGPYAAIARNQELIRAVMEAAAVAADADDLDAPAGSDPEQVAWLEEWSLAVAEWSPTLEQVEVFLSALSLLLGVILYAATSVDVEVPDDDLLTVLGLLCAAGALVVNRVRRARRE